MSRALSLVPARVARRCHWLDFRAPAMTSWLLIGRRTSDLAGRILLLARREEKGGEGRRKEENGGTRRSLMGVKTT